MQRQRAIALLVAVCFFMENLDGTILTTAAPSIARDLGTESTAVGLAVTAFLLTVAVLIPVSGWLTERFGARRVFAVAIAVFTIASILCAASVSLPMLIAMRVLQGIGGALMVPVGRLAVLRVTPKERLIQAIALLTWPALAAPIIAPFLGGLITTYASWHWIFLINVPVGIAAFIIALRIVPDFAGAAVPPLDWRGLVLACTGLAGLVYASALVSGVGFDLGAFLVSLVVGVVLLAFAVRHLLRASHPFVDLRLLRVETFRLANAGGSVYRLTISAVPFLLPLLFQDAFGWTPVEAGAVVLFLFAGNLAIKPATTWMLRTFGFKILLVASGAIGALCMVAMAFLTASTPIVVTAALLFLSGVARSVGFTAYNTITFADVEQPQMAGANTLNSTLQQVASGFGVTVGAILLSSGFAVDDAVHGGPLLPYGFAFIAIAVLTLYPTFEALALSRAAGSGVIVKAAAPRR
ncbi:MFS transporter [Plantibacter sp. Mn2098]|uniref:MFS transporter n=1 Tax=Plantibacter sp. Mn2098 TaxID=3395266 RepID=UPI003BE19332